MAGGRIINTKGIIPFGSDLWGWVVNIYDCLGHWVLVPQLEHQIKNSLEALNKYSKYRMRMIDDLMLTGFVF